MDSESAVQAAKFMAKNTQTPVWIIVSEHGDLSVTSDRLLAARSNVLEIVHPIDEPRWASNKTEKDCKYYTQE